MGWCVPISGGVCKERTLEESLLDEAVRRVLTLKFEQGLFEHPYLPEKTLLSFDLADYPQSEQLAEESVVLLKNTGVLPLAKTVKNFGSWTKCR